MNQKMKQLWSEAMKFANNNVSIELNDNYYLKHEKVLCEKFKELMMEEYDKNNKLSQEENNLYILDKVNEYLEYIGYREKENVFI